MKKKLAIAAAMFSALTGAVSAQQVEQLFSYKHWSVSLVGWDDGSIGCVAEVAIPSDSFSIWTYPDGAVSLQFYSTSWDFGEEQLADVTFEIDRRGPWTATATLKANSVWVDLPDSDKGVQLITEVARGNRIYLRDANGADVQDYSLAGSSASIDALIQCGNVIQDPTPDNPFN